MCHIIKGVVDNSPIVHELDTTDLTKWTENIYEKARQTFADYLDRFEKDPSSNLNQRSESIEYVNLNEEIHQYNKCEICDRIFINKSQWDGNFRHF